jgi:hypothetical protein
MRGRKVARSSHIVLGCANQVTWVRFVGPPGCVDSPGSAGDRANLLGCDRRQLCRRDLNPGTDEQRSYRSE